MSITIDRLGWLAVALLCAGCGGGGGGGGGAAAGGGSSALPQIPAVADQPPQVGALPASLTVMGAATTLQVTASDPEGGALTYAWATAGTVPAAPRFAAPGQASTAVEFPLAGTYDVRLTVTDRAGNAVVRSTTITVDPADSFSLATVVNDNLPLRSGVRARLVWVPTGIEILSASTDNDGALSFSGLKGSPGDFQVRVSGGR